MPEVCPLCEGAGLRVVERADGTRVATPCECRVALRSTRMIEQARIPRRHAHCTLENFDTKFPKAHRSLGNALLQARNFVTAYPLETDGRGLLFVGRPGLGKTHLSIGLLRALIDERGAKGLFVDYRDLLKKVQDSYNPAVSTTELGILRPVFDAEVLVIDDLGANKPTDWVFDTVAHILNSRYNDQLTTIITTNFANLPERTAEEMAGMNEAQRVMSDRTLGDRIGDRVLSRLREMCVVVEMQGGDFRDKIKRASFGVNISHSSAVPTDAEVSNDSSLDVREKLATEAEARLFRKRGDPEVGGRRLTLGENDKENIEGARSLAKYSGK